MRKHVPERRTLQPLGDDLLGGQVHLMFADALTASPQIKAGLPGYEAYSWTALFAPAKTPQTVLDKINADFNTAFKDPAVRQRLLEAGAEAAPGTQQEMRQFLRTELAKWAKVIKTAGITTG